MATDVVAHDVSSKATGSTTTAEADPQTLRQLSQLLREVALQSHPWEQVACLNGKRWLEFLDRTGDTTQFTKGPVKFWRCPTVHRANH